MKIGDWGIKIGAILLACFLWFHAVTEHSYTREISVRLIVEDPPLDAAAANQPVIVANRVPEDVNVLVTGRGKDLLQLEKDDFVLRLQTEGKIASRRTYRLQLNQIEQRNAELNVQLEEIIAPTDVEIQFDRRVEKDLLVVPNINLQIAPAHVQVGSLLAEPRFVRIVGPESIVKTMTTIATDSLVLVDVREDVDRVVTLRQPAEKLWTLEPSTVRVRADVQILADNDIANVPVKIYNAGERPLRADPEYVTVKVRGGVDVVSSLDPQTDLRLYVDFLAFQSGERGVQKADHGTDFEILEINPAQVNVVSR
jgi:YbbR domain-containing protein